jgi:hypothetical protein
MESLYSKLRNYMIQNHLSVVDLVGECCGTLRFNVVLLRQENILVLVEG